MMALLIMATPVRIAAGSEPPQATAARTFGQRQLEQLLDDRPDMKGVLPPGHPILKWVEEGFNGNRFGQRVYWIAESPRGGYPSEFSPPFERAVPAFIRITAGTELTPLDKWSALVFELHNLEENERFADLSDRAAKGLLSGEEYAKSCVEVEFDAGKKTTELLEANPLPKSVHGRDRLLQETIRQRGTFEEFWAEGKANNERLGNYEYYLNHYKQVLEPAAAAYKAGNAAGDR